MSMEQRVSSPLGPAVFPAEIRTVEGSLVGDVVNQQNAHSTSIVCGCDGTEALLASGVPDLQLHPLAVEFDGADLEVDTNGCDEGRREGVFAKAEQAA
jgi:hypothetical protein